MSADSARSISSVVERQMRNWEIARQQAVPGTEPTEDRFQPFITVSRAVGSGGEAVARALAERVRWPLFDRALLQHMAGKDELRRRIYESLDERDLDFINQSLRQFLHGSFDRDDYFHRLGEAVLSLARHAPAVIVGRAADLMLPRDQGLRVRLNAPLDFCCKAYADEHQLDPGSASREIERIRAERGQFIRNHFQTEPDAIGRYDVSLNLASVTTIEAVDTILALARARGLLTS